MTRHTPPQHRGHRWRVQGLILAAGLSTLVPAYAATIFRTIDANGNPVFSDTPPPAGQHAETIVIEGPAAVFDPEALPQAAEAAAWDWDINASGADPESTAYSTVSVQWPAHDEAVRENAGNVTVTALVDPNLRPGHRLVLLMDGETVAHSTGNSFALTEVDRGSHTLVIQVVDDAGGILASSEPSVFHMLRHAPRLAPNRPGPSSP